MGCPTWTISAIKWMEYFADLLFYWTFIGIFVLIMVNPSLLLVFPAPMVIGAALFVSVVLKIFTSITILCGLHESWGLFTSMLIYFLIFLGLAAVVLKTKAPIIMEYASPTKLKEVAEKLSSCLLQEGATSVTDIVNQQTNAIANNVNQQANAVANNALQQTNAVANNALQQTNAVGQSLAQQTNAVANNALQQTNAVANNALQQTNAVGQSLAQPIVAANNAALQANAVGQSLAQPMPQITINVPQAK
ncbi:MAG: hypothetical protein Ct9H90mP28_3800 [Paracoccaceae bacterium]|nr:MAG: hypothetical protein Ct9H90mP28_3800 [Paracoccaceae bacterium]